MFLNWKFVVKLDFQQLLYILDFQRPRQKILYEKNLFLYFFEYKHVQNLISKKSTRAYKYHATSRFIDDLCVINDNGEFSKFFKYIYPGELEPKLERSWIHATFLDLDIKIDVGIFAYKLFDKREKFPFFIVHMPQ